jgi:AraC-like DNA-binding protein
MIINAISSGTFFLLSFLLFVKSFHENRYANRWLSLSFVSIGLTLLDVSLSRSGFYLQYPHYEELIGLLIFALIPSIYLATCHFVSPDRGFRIKDLLHFLPFFSFAVLNIPFFLMSASEKLAITKHNENPTNASSIATLIIMFLLYGQCAVYWFLSYRLIQKHEKNIQKINSSTDLIDLAWLKQMLWGLLLMLILWIIQDSFLQEISITVWGFLISAFYIASFAISQKEIYPYRKEELIVISEIINQIPQNESVEEVSEISRKKLEELFLTQKPYLEPDLTLPKLADMMQMTTHELSGLINNGFQKNFYHFINGYRIEECKRFLEDSKEDSVNMLGIAYDSGFNSKTTFNTAFKAYTGVSPTEYLKTKRV